MEMVSIPCRAEFNMIPTDTSTVRDRPVFVPDEQHDARAIRFLLDRIDYERTPPVQNPSEPFKLERMAKLLRSLGDPQFDLPAVHIAGSKGKGSTAAMLEAILRGAGIRTGLFTSPHIHHFEERIQIDGKPITGGRFSELIETVRPVAEEMDHSPWGGPTFFELLTAMAWLEYRARKVEIVVLEVGLGGRLDATTICAPWACVITSISRDHTRILGDSLSSIAREKAGIIKPGIPLFTGVRDGEAARVIADQAESNSAPLYSLGNEITVSGPNLPCESFFPAERVDIRTPWRLHAGLSVPLPGRHQHENAALALAVADYLKDGGHLCLETDRWIQSLGAVDWPLRIEVVGREPWIVLDAAHNEASMAALIDTLTGRKVKRSRVIFGTSRDKEAAAMLRQLDTFFDEIILTQYHGNPRALPVQELAEIAQHTLGRTVDAVPSPQDALRRVLSLSGEEDLVCVTGSFFLAGEIRAMLVEEAPAASCRPVV